MNEGAGTGPMAKGLFPLLAILSALILSVVLAAEVAAALLTSFEVSSNLLDNAGFEYDLFILIPGPFVLLKLKGIGALAYYLFLLACAIASFLVLTVKTLGHFKTGGGGSRRESLAGSPIADIAVFATVYVFVTVLVGAVSSLVGLSTGASVGSGSVPGWELAAGAMRASVWEEILCRVCLMGLPLMAVAVASGEREGLGKYVIGGFEYNRFVPLFLILSSLVFGYAHYDGWGLWKVLPTFVSGLIQGWLFHKRGLYAAIMLHFFIDFHDFEAMLGLDTNIVGPAVFLPFAAFGLFFTAWFVLTALRRASDRKSGEPGETPGPGP